MAKRFVAVFALAATMLVGGQAGAQQFTEGVRPAGMGQAYTGVASGASGIFHNPGGIASRMMYQIEGTFDYNPYGSVLNASVVDSKTNPDIAAGVAYSYFFGRGDFENFIGHDVHLGVALPVLPERISIGLAGRYLYLEEGDPEGDVELMNGITIDAGILFRAIDDLQIGVAGRNLIDACKREQECSTVAPTQISGGISYGSETTFLVSADGGIDLTSDPENVHPFFEFGAEYFAGETVPLRVGYQRLQATEQHIITAGGGARLDTAGLDLGFRIDPEDTDQLWVNGSVSVYF